MEGVLDLNKAVITLGSMTYAIKSRKLLSKNGIRSKLVKLDSSKTLNGCSYGIELLDKEFYAAIAVLRNEGIGYSIYKEK